MSDMRELPDYTTFNTEELVSLLPELARYPEDKDHYQVVLKILKERKRYD